MRRNWDERRIGLRSCISFIVTGAEGVLGVGGSVYDEEGRFSQTTS